MSSDSQISGTPQTPQQSAPQQESSQPGSGGAAQSAARPRWRWAVWLAVICLIAGGGYLLSQKMPSGQQSTSAKGGRRAGGGAIPVSGATAQKGDLGVYITGLGTVTPVYTVTVTSRVVGQIMEVDYKEGQIVDKGQRLAVVDPRPYHATLLQAQGQLMRDQALLKNAYVDLDRYKEAYQHHAIPQQQLVTQQATVDQDEGTVKSDQGNVEAAQVNMDYTDITSPIKGRIGLRLVDPGNIVQANGTTGIATIAQLEPITVIFPVAEDYISEVVEEMRKGHALRVDALDRDQQTELAQGKLLTIDNQVDTTTGTVRFRATFPNHDYRLFPNEFVNAKLQLRVLHNATIIPTAAVQRNGDTPFVYLIEANKTVKSQNVKIETEDGNSAAVTGINPGDMIVTDGFDRLQDGVKVSVEKEGAPATQPATTTQPSERVLPAHPPTQGSANTQLNTNTKSNRAPQQQ